MSIIFLLRCRGEFRGGGRLRRELPPPPPPEDEVRDAAAQQAAAAAAAAAAASRRRVRPADQHQEQHRQPGMHLHPLEVFFSFPRQVFSINTFQSQDVTYAELTLPRGGRGASSSSSSSVPPPPLLCAARRPPPPPLHSSSSASTSASSSAPAASEQPVVYARINHSCPSKQPLAPLVRVKSPPPSMLRQPPLFFVTCDRNRNRQIAWTFVSNFTGVFCLLALSLSCTFTFFQSVHLLIFILHPSPPSR